MELEQQLRAALMPRSPGPALRAGVMARVRRQARGWNRRILWGAVLVVAAAAAMLATRVVDEPAVAVHVESTQPVIAEAVRPSPVVDPEPAPLVAPVPVKPFTVSVQLQNAAEGGAAAAVDAFFRALLDNLRAVPGLVLVDPGKAGASDADYMLRVSGSGARDDDHFGINIYQDSRAKGGGTFLQRALEGAGGDISPTCAGTLPCSDPLGLAADMLGWLRGVVLPADAGYTAQLRASLLDPAVDPQQRYNALQTLYLISRRAKSGSSPDPSILRGAADLAATVRRPELRAEVWRMLRGARDPELAPALVASLRDDASAAVRIEAMATLRADFHDDPRYRAALEKVARQDDSPLMQALARRELTGDAAAWRQHIVSSLQDTALPPAQRIEAFAYQMYGVTPGRRSDISQGDPKFLDDEVIDALASALPEALKLPQMEWLRHGVVSSMLATGKPAALAVVLDLAKAEDDQASRSALLDQIAKAGINPALRAALEHASAEDADPRRRQLAAEVLQSVKPAATAMPIPDIINLVLGRLKQTSDAQARANVIRNLAQGMRDPVVRESLEKISRDDPDPELRKIAADVLEAASRY